MAVITNIPTNSKEIIGTPAATIGSYIQNTISSTIIVLAINFFISLIY